MSNRGLIGGEVVKMLLCDWPNPTDSVQLYSVHEVDYLQHIDLLYTIVYRFRKKGNVNMINVTKTEERAVSKILSLQDDSIGPTLFQ